MSSRPIAAAAPPPPTLRCRSRSVAADAPSPQPLRRRRRSVAADPPPPRFTNTKLQKHQQRLQVSKKHQKTSPIFSNNFFFFFSQNSYYTNVVNLESTTNVFYRKPPQKPDLKNLLRFKIRSDSRNVDRERFKLSQASFIQKPLHPTPRNYIHPKFHQKSHF